MVSTGRFAPSTTGPAHPGTLLAALLAWLDARKVGARFILRLEDLDPDRCRAEFLDAIEQALDWLGLDWDQRAVQSESTARHEAAIDQLASLGLLYPCSCSRKDKARLKRRAPDGSWAYDNRCRGTQLPPKGWRGTNVPLRVHLPDDEVCLVDELGVDCSQIPARDMGDPVVRRRDGSVAYQLAVIVDDHESGVDRVVRGRDIAPSTATQVALCRLLGLTIPSYRHHFLLMESSESGKLAKRHGSMPVDQLQARYQPAEAVGVLACFAGLINQPCAMTPHELVARFDWARVRRDDRAVRWDRTELR